MNSLEMCKLAVETASDKKALDIKVLDLQGISPLTDYFVIVSATNPNQMNAIHEGINEAFHTKDMMQRSTEGNQNSGWILLDFNDVVIHIFGQQEREFYGLDNIWKDAKILEI